MKVVMIGTGYVGLVSGTCFAEMGHEVTCIDIDEKKVEILKKGESPIYEPGLTDLLKRNILTKRLNFSTSFESVSEAAVIFLAVGTPSSDSGEADLQYLDKAAEMVAEYLSDNSVIVIKSTVPVGTGLKLREVIGRKTNKKFYIVNNPEFLKEGAAVDDFMKPDRVVIGCDDEFASNLMKELYAPLTRQGNPIFIMSNLSAEMSKYAANCFLATKISFINEIARLCDKTGADIEEVRKGISSDRRIGSHFLYPGPGYGGSCFPKDVKALMYTASEHDMELKIVAAAELVNEEQKVYMLSKIKKCHGERLEGKTFSFWGVAFKANTDDIRESAAVYLAESLMELGARVHFYDPVAAKNFSSHFSQVDSLKSFEDKYDCLENSDGLITMTEWREFKTPEFDQIKKRLNYPVVFDARNLYEPKKVLSAGLEYYGLGQYIPEVL